MHIQIQEAKAFNEDKPNKACSKTHYISFSCCCEWIPSPLTWSLKYSKLVVYLRVIDVYY